MIDMNTLKKLQLQEKLNYEKELQDFKTFLAKYENTNDCSIKIKVKKYNWLWDEVLTFTKSLEISKGLLCKIVNKLIEENDTEIEKMLEKR